MQQPRNHYPQSFKEQVPDDYFHSGMSLSADYPCESMGTLCGLFGKSKQAWTVHKKQNNRFYTFPSKKFVQFKIFL